MFERELKEYNHQKAKLLENYEGLYAVFKNEELLDVFFSWQDAFRQGWRKWGEEEFLVKEIRQSKDSVNWYPIYEKDRRFIIETSMPLVHAYARDGKIHGWGRDAREAIDDLLEKLKVREWLES